MTRKFKKLDGNATIPERATEHSAGYDISASETVTIQPDEIKMVSTGLAVQLGHDEVLKLYDRSSNPVKRGIALINSVGIIDSDYYPNEFKGLFMNISKERCSDTAYAVKLTSGLKKDNLVLMMKFLC